MISSSTAIVSADPPNSQTPLSRVVLFTPPLFYNTITWR